MALFYYIDVNLKHIRVSKELTRKGDVPVTCADTSDLEKISVINHLLRFIKVCVSLRDGITLITIRNNFIHVTLIRCIQSKQMMDASFLA